MFRDCLSCDYAVETNIGKFCRLFGSQCRNVISCQVSDKCVLPLAKTRSLYPLTITLDRYTGAYSGGKWTAWNCEPGEIPEGPFADDVGCASFWADNRTPVGIGESPEAAIADLNRKIEEENE